MSCVQIELEDQPAEEGDVRLFAVLYLVAAVSPVVVVAAADAVFVVAAAAAVVVVVVAAAAAVVVVVAAAAVVVVAAAAVVFVVLVVAVFDVLLLVCLAIACIHDGPSLLFSSALVVVALDGPRRSGLARRGRP